MIRLVLCAFLLEIIAFLFFINQWFFSDTSSYALATIALAASDNITDSKLKPATEQFMNELESVGQKPVLIQKIKRLPFSAEGVLIGLNNDNVQIFEYPDHETAQKEGVAFAQKYTRETSPKNLWRSVTHIYIRNKMIIFYMGKDANILSALNKDMNSI